MKRLLAVGLLILVVAFSVAMCIPLYPGPNEEEPTVEETSQEKNDPVVPTPEPVVEKTTVSPGPIDPGPLPDTGGPSK